MATPKKTTASANKPAAAKKTSGTPLTTKMASRLAAINISASTEEEARELLNKIFKANDITDVQDDPLDDLILMAEAFPTDGDPIEEEEEVDEVIEVETEEEEEEEQFEEETEEEEEEEPVMVTKKKTPAKTKKSVVEEPEEEEEELTPKKTVKKSIPKKSAKVEEEEDMTDLVEEVEEKELKIPRKKFVSKKIVATAKKPKTQTTRARKLEGTHWEFLTDEQKDKAVKPLRKILNSKEFRIHYLERSFMVKLLGKATEHNIFKFHLVRLLSDGSLEGTFVSHRFKTPDDFAEFFNEGEHKIKQGASCSYINPLNTKQILELLGDTDFLSKSIAIATKQDVKMRNNRDKLDAQLNAVKEEKSTVKKPAPATKAKTAAPAKTTAKATPKKVAAKKKK